MASLLHFEIRPSPASNDSEVRIIVDGHDWLGKDYLGLDPPELIAQLKGQISDRPLLVGRCICGALGCDDVIVTFRREGENTYWDDLAFDNGQYDRVVDELASDHSWEDLGRRVERLVGGLFSGSRTVEGWNFEWASTRIKRNLVPSVVLERRRADTFRFQLGWLDGGKRVAEGAAALSGAG